VFGDSSSAQPDAQNQMLAPIGLAAQAPSRQPKNKGEALQNQLRCSFAALANPNNTPCADQTGLL
jgi:hypothetical protein